jgi:hypothetical protein
MIPVDELMAGSTVPLVDTAVRSAPTELDGLLLTPGRPVMFAAVSWLLVTERLLKSVAAFTCLARVDQLITKFSNDTTDTAEATGAA